MDILRQLGELLLGSVPTILFFVLLVTAYTFLVRGPMERTLAERRARTSGAIEQARAALAAAEAETAVFEDKLRSARAEILAEREKRLKGWQAERDTAVAGARELASDRVRRAKGDIEASAASARGQIEATAAEMGDQILRSLLPSEAWAEVQR